MTYTIIQFAILVYVLYLAYGLFKNYLSAKSEAERLFKKVSKNLDFELNYEIDKAEEAKKKGIKKMSVTTDWNDYIQSLKQFKEEVYSTRDKYIALSERFKHNKKLKEIVQDWLDYITIIDRLQPDETAVKYNIDSETRGVSFDQINEYRLRRREIIKRFEKMLSSNK